MSMFEKAKASPVAAPKPKAKKDEKARIAMPGLETYAALVAVGKQIETMSKTMATQIKSRMAIEFQASGMKHRKRPDNFKGFEGIGEASCELRVRSSSSPLTVEEIEMLKEHNIPVREDDVVVETFIINPEYASNSDLLERVSKALEGVKGMPNDFILHQSQKKVCVDETTIDAVFAIEDPKIVAQLFPLVAVLAIKPTVSDEEKAFEKIGDILFETVEAA